MPTVINHYNQTVPEGAIWIMRGKSALANQWSHLGGVAKEYQCADREEAIEKFYRWLFNKVCIEGDPHILTALDAIKEDSVLVCCCAPRLCHGDAIIEIWKEYHK
jgi:hypothetical protein